MKQTRKYRKKRRNASNLADRVVLVCILLLAGLVPLLVHSKEQIKIMPVIDPLLNLTTTKYIDYFTFYKAAALFLIAAFLLIWLIIKVFTGEKALKPMSLSIPVAVFTLALCFSVLASDYKTFAIWGGYTRNLGALTYLACTLIFFVVINSRVEAKWTTKIAWALCPLVIVNTIMMVIIFCGVNLWDNSLFSQLVAGKARVFLAEDARIYGTLNHPNYLSGLGAIMFAFFAAKATSKESAFLLNRELLLYTIMAVFSTIMVYTSQAQSGAVTLAFVLPLLIGYILEQRKKEGLYLPVIFVLTAISWIALSLRNDSFLRELVADAGLLLVSAGFGLIFFGFYLLVKNWRNLNKRWVALGGGAILVICLIISYLVVPLAKEKIMAEFKRTNTDLIMERLEKDPFDLPEPRFGWGTGRVYIWQNTLKLVAEKPIFGYGFDTLPFEFNQGDPAKIAALEKANTVVDKPHNVYINMLYGAGVIAFLAFLAIVVLVIWRALKAFSTESEYCYMIWPLLLGVLAYLYQGMFNDPVQGVEQIFWVLMGLTYALADKAGVSKREELSKRL